MNFVVCENCGKRISDVFLEYKECPECNHKFYNAFEKDVTYLLVGIDETLRNIESFFEHIYYNR